MNLFGPLTSVANDSKRWRNSVCTRSHFSSRCVRSSAKKKEEKKEKKKEEKTKNEKSEEYIRQTNHLAAVQSTPLDSIDFRSRCLCFCSRLTIYPSTRPAPFPPLCIAFPGILCPDKQAIEIFGCPLAANFANTRLKR